MHRWASIHNPSNKLLDFCRNYITVYGTYELLGFNWGKNGKLPQSTSILQSGEWMDFPSLGYLACLSIHVPGMEPELWTHRGTRFRNVLERPDQAVCQWDTPLTCLYTLTLSLKKKILTNGITSHKLRQHLKESMTFLLGREALGPSINLSSFSQNFEMDNSKSETTNPSN